MDSEHMKNRLYQDTFQHRSYSSFLLSTEKKKANNKQTKTPHSTLYLPSLFKQACKLSLGKSTMPLPGLLAKLLTDQIPYFS